MAAIFLAGKPMSEIQVQKASLGSLAINTKAAADQGVKLPDDVLNAANQTYNEILQERVNQTFIGTGISAQGLEAIYAFVKDEALRSFKNGLAAGRKPKSASERGSALQAGRLKPVIQGSA